MRRLTLTKSASAGITCATSTPTAFAAASAARPFITLCRPDMLPAHGRRPRRRDAAPRTREPSAASRRALQSRSPPMPKRSTGVQQPMASTSRQRRVLAVDDQPAAARHDAHQVVELALDRGQVREDVGVVELEVVEDRDRRAGSARTCCACRRTRCRTRRPRPRTRGRCRCAPTRRSFPARRRPGSPGRGPRLPSSQASMRRGGGLAVGAGHGQRLAAGQHVLAQPLRAGGVAQAGIEHVFHRRIAARQRIADHHLVGVGGDVRGRVAGVAARCPAARAGWSSADRRSGPSRPRLWPSSRASAATPPMKVPQIPRIWSFMGFRMAGIRERAETAGGTRANSSSDLGQNSRPTGQR